MSHSRLSILGGAFFLCDQVTRGYTHTIAESRVGTTMAEMKLFIKSRWETAEAYKFNERLKQLGDTIERCQEAGLVVQGAEKNKQCSIMWRYNVYSAQRERESCCMVRCFAHGILLVKKYYPTTTNQLNKKSRNFYI